MGRSGLARIGMIVLIGLLGVCACIPLEVNPDDPFPTAGWETATVARVVDGDTLVLDNGSRLRLIGINAPEIGEREEPYGVEAAAWLRENVSGKTVFLQKDVSDTDQYGRLLRYVWLQVPQNLDPQSVEQWMVSALMVAQGYAQPYTFPPDVMYADLIMILARKARVEERGLWAINPEGTTRGTALD